MGANSLSHTRWDCSYHIIFDEICVLLAGSLIQKHGPFRFSLINSNWLQFEN